MDTAVKDTTPGGEALEFPVSFAQRRLWFLEQLEGANAAYNVRLPVRLTGPLDPDRFQAAVNLLVERHESLRTRFAVRHGEPIQQIDETAAIEVTVLDMPGASADAIRTRLGRLANWNFDIEAGPLLQVFLIRETADSHTLLLLTHHMISDAWSSGVLFRDLMKFYAALGRGSRPELPELPVQYADYAVWQREWLAGPELQRQLEYWQRALQGAAPLLELPTDRPRPARQSYRGSRWALNLDQPLLHELRSLAVSQSATLYMVLLSAFYVLLSRHSGQRDVVVGSPIAGRQRTELENLVGFFANTLALRTDCDLQLGFRDFLRQVRQISLEAFAHQDLPFERLVEALQPARRLSHSTIFQVMFVLQNAPWEAEEIAELSFSPAEMAPGDSAKYDLTLSVAEADDGLWASFEYNTDLFDAETVKRFASAYESLLRGIVKDPGCALMDLPLQAPDRLQVEQAAWNNTVEAGFVEPELAARLAQSAARYPARKALSFGEQSFTYKRLRQAVTGLADELRGAGVRSNTGIAICMQRSAGMVIAMLASLDCEAPYVPLDPDYPGTRLRYMLADSGAAILITDETTAFDDFDGTVLAVSPNGELLYQRSGNREPLPLDDSEQLAYLIYTSGSTGQPKGVKLTTTSVLNFLQSMAREPGLQVNDRMLAVTTLCFDISVLEILLPLLVGAEVILAPTQMQTDGRALAALLDSSAATVMQATPATWTLLLGSGWSGNGSLRIFCGGEVLDQSLAARLLTAGSELWNLYGPTETTVWSTVTRISSIDKGISVGRPIANTRLWVVDELLRPLPARVPGELLIGGAGLSCGYHQRDELTAAKFVCLPATGERVYRTGDRARWRSDGELELLGRLDTQVKLRGFRIELGEVEAALLAQPEVAAAAAGVRTAPGGDARLVAWVVPATDEVDVASLRSELGRQLPDYMVPGQWMSVASLPLTPNGKVDRRALPAPVWSGQPTDDTAARTPLEGAVCELFAGVLACGQVGVHADFFALGGHSLLATQLVSRVRDALGVELALRAIFEAPTPAGIAEHIDSVELSVALQALPIQVATGNDQAPATFMQRRLWFLDQLQPGNPVYNLVWSARLEGALDKSALEAAVSALTARHGSLRTHFLDRDGEPWQVVSQAVPVGVQWEACAADSLSTRSAELVSQPFNLGTGPLWRVHCLSAGKAEHRLLVVVHHIVADGWSLGVLFRELAQAYNAARQGEAVDWMPLPLQYTDYARWQQERLAAGELSRQLAYWREQLAGAPMSLALPTDRARPSVQSYRGARLSYQLDNEISEACQSVARETGCTLFMVLASGLAVVLGRLAGSEQVLLGTPIAGRGRTELEGLVGFFVNTLVLRADLSGNPSFRQLLTRVRQAALEAYAHPDLPFEKLVEDLSLPRDPARTPVFQVMFNLHNEPQQDFVFQDLNFSPAAVERDTAKFDLTVAATDTRDGLLFNVEYNADLFHAHSISLICSELRSVLLSLSAGVESRLGDGSVKVSSPGLVLPAWAGARHVWSAFAAVAAAAPKQLAISSATTRWSYGALAEYASRVAQACVSAGVGAGDRVGLLAGHDAQAIAGVLGILQAGGAYVVLDPRDPVSRQQAVLADAGVRALVSDSGCLAQAQSLGLPVVAVDTQADGRQTAPVAHPGQGSELAYVLYTSGTTGTPKGVMQSHAGLLAQVGGYAASLELDRADRLSLLSGLGYDAAVQDVFGALLSGASLHLLDLRDGRDAGAQVEELGAAGVTVVHATPTVYRYLFGGELDCRHGLGAVRRVVLGGEVARRSDLALFRSRFASAVLVNGYGLTECTVGLQWQATAQTVVAGDDLPLGVPVGEVAVRVMGADGQASWLGEIQVAGPGLAQGYWGDAALTAARFVADESAPGGRWYRTGDRGWRRPDGTLGYLGRQDDQVKLRGHRLELGEVESVLLGYPGLSAVAAGVVRSAAGDDQLVAWTAGAPVEPAALRSWCRSRLPDWAVPAAWVALPSLPRLANGKVARAQLPAPAREAGPERAVRPGLEADLARLWAQLLGLEAVAPHEDFFALGGHSLLATRLVARIREQFGREIPLLTVFEHPTVSVLARIMADLPDAGEKGNRPVLEPVNRKSSNSRPA